MKKETPKLGQHFLKDKRYLDTIAEFAEVNQDDSILEIGPGQGDLTAIIARKAKNVTCVELDEVLAERLKGQVADNVEIINKDIRGFDLGHLPEGYKVAANIPYYISGEIIRLLLEADNQPESITLLVQKEVAQRAAAKPGKMSVLAIASQMYSDVELGAEVPAIAFSPPPKVDSQIVRFRVISEPRINVDHDKFFKLVKQAFAMKRKKLSNSLAGYENGLQVLKELNLSAKRPQELDFEQWERLYEELYK